MSQRIYTRTGDQGTTGLFGGERVSKASRRVEAYGTIDELNASLGLVVALGVPDRAQADLVSLQHMLFQLGAELSTPNPEKLRSRALGGEEVRWLERQIDVYEAELKPLANFILPGGTLGASAMHMARAVCRRAERGCVALQEQEPSVRPLVTIFLNRLSDFLFVLARYINHAQGVPDVNWRPEGQG